MKRVRYSVLLAVAAGALACDSTETVIPLTADQATAIVQTVLDLSNEVGEGTTVELCPLGGGARIVLTSDEGESGDTLWESSELVIRPAVCEIEAGGDTLALDGAPDLTLNWGQWYASESEEGEHDVTATGAVDWRRNDRSSDRCEVELDLKVVLGPDTNEDDLGYLTGLVCGRDVEIPWPPRSGTARGP